MITFNSIITTDALEGMKQLHSESIDLTVTSPPYDDLRKYHGGSFSIKEIADELFRITKPGGVVVWVVADESVNGSETANSYRHILQFMESGFGLNDTMIYMRTGTTFTSANSPRYEQMFDFMFVLSKGKPKTFNRIRDIPKLWEGSWGRTTVRQKDGSLTGTEHAKNAMGTTRDETGKYGWKGRGNVWLYANGGRFKAYNAEDWKIIKGHPAIFPYMLVEDHIISWSNEGDVVFDPFSGSGTVGLAARNNKRNFLMFDISPVYTEIAKKRLKIGD